MNHNLRNATENDIKDIMQIENASFNENICEKEEHFLERIQVFSDGFYVMEKDENIVGYISTEIWTYEEKVSHKSFSLGHSIKNSHHPEGNELYISSMGVLPNYRGQGLGKILFQQVTNRIICEKGHVTSLILIVSEKWENAIKIYLENGFKEISIIDDFFIDKNHATEKGMVMRKYLV